MSEKQGKVCQEKHCLQLVLSETTGETDELWARDPQQQQLLREASRYQVAGKSPIQNKMEKK